MKKLILIISILILNEISLAENLNNKDSFIQTENITKESSFMFKNWQERFYYNPHTQKLEIKKPWEEIEYFKTK